MRTSYLAAAICVAAAPFGEASAGPIQYTQSHRVVALNANQASSSDTGPFSHSFNVSSTVYAMQNSQLANNQIAGTGSFRVVGPAGGGTATAGSSLSATFHLTQQSSYTLSGYLMYYPNASSVWTPVRLEITGPKGFSIVHELGLVSANSPQPFNNSGEMSPGTYTVTMSAQCWAEAATARGAEWQFTFDVIPVQVCTGDINGSGAVDVNDLLAVINAWGQCPAAPATCPPDIAPPGGDGVVNVNDLLAVVNAWGPCR
jgi:hypothetical protein